MTQIFCVAILIFVYDYDLKDIYYAPFNMKSKFMYFIKTVYIRTRSNFSVNHKHQSKCSHVPIYGELIIKGNDLYSKSFFYFSSVLNDAHIAKSLQ